MGSPNCHKVSVDRLDELARRPDGIRARGLEIDPTFAPLRSNPRFQKLLARG